MIRTESSLISCCNLQDLRSPTNVAIFSFFVLDADQEFHYFFLRYGCHPFSRLEIWAKEHLFPSLPSRTGKNMFGVFPPPPPPPPPPLPPPQKLRLSLSSLLLSSSWQNAYFSCLCNFYKARLSFFQNSV